MSSEEDKFKHSARRKNKIRRDTTNDFKGAFSIKVIDARKPEYERKKLRVTDLYEGYEEDATDN